MVAGKHKSRTFRKVFRKTPGNKVVTQYKKRKPSKAKCGMCGKTLSGTLTSSKSTMQNTAKTKKRPERPYGGVLCASCMKKVIIRKTREEEK